MPIKAERFKLLSDETHVASSPFGAGVDDGLVNTIQNKLKETGSAIDDLISNALPGPIKEMISNAKDALAPYARDIKSVAGKQIDYTKVPDELFGKFTTSLPGIDAKQAKSLQDLLKKCGRGSNYNYGGRPYDVSMNCRGNKASLGGFGSGSSCNASSFSNLLDGLTQGNYQKGYRDLSSAMRAAMAISGYGYNLGLCGVLSSIKTSDIFNKLGLGNLEYSKIAGSLLGIVGKEGNTNGWLDIAGNSAGLSPLLVNPGASSDLLNNFSIPSSLRDSSLTDLGTRTLESLEGIDISWAKSLKDNIPSLKSFDTVTDDFKDMADAYLTDRSFDINQLDEIPQEDNDFLMTAALAW